MLLMPVKTTFRSCSYLSGLLPRLIGVLLIFSSTFISVIQHAEWLTGDIAFELVENGEKEKSDSKEDRKKQHEEITQSLFLLFQNDAASIDAHLFSLKNRYQSPLISIFTPPPEQIV